MTAIILLALILALLPAASVHGNGGVLDGAWYLSMAAMTLRCVFFTAAMSIIGVSAAAIGRSTTAAVIGIVLYFVLIEYTAVQAAPSFAAVVALHRCRLVDRLSHHRRRSRRAYRCYRRVAPGRGNGGPLGVSDEDLRAPRRDVTMSRALQGSALGAIAAKLNEEGVPTAREGGRWHTSTVAHVVRSVDLDEELRKIRSGSRRN